MATHNILPPDNIIEDLSEEERAELSPSRPKLKTDNRVFKKKDIGLDEHQDNRGKNILIIRGGSISERQCQ